MASPRERIAAVGRRLRRVVHGLSLTASLVAGLALVFVMLAVVTDVTSRNLRGRSILGLIDWTEIVLVLVVFLALAQTQRRHEHVAVEAVINRVRGWRYRALRVLAGLVAIGVVFLLAWATTRLAIDSFGRGEYRLGLAQVPVWPARIAIAVAFVLWLLELVTAAVEAYSRDPDEARVYEAGDL